MNASNEIRGETVADVELVKDRAWRNVPSLACDQVVEDVHVPSFSEKPLGHVRADESRSTGDDCRLH